MLDTIHHSFEGGALEEARELRQQGIRAAKAGQKDEARRLLQQSLRIDPDSEPAWLWLASVANNNRERVFCLNKVIELNPSNETARQALESLNEPPMVANETTRMQTAPVARSTIDELTEQQPGIPVAPPDRIAALQDQIEKLVRETSFAVPARVKWVHKTRGRAGERDIILYRVQVGIAVMVFLAILGGIGIFAVQTNDSLRGVVFGPSATPTPPPTITPTYTPGYTATPSVTPRLTPEPSATVPPNVPAASPPALPAATSIYPNILERAVINAVALIDQGQYPRAISTLERERAQTFDSTFSANVYYYQAIALAQTGDFRAALDVLDEADGRIGDRPEAQRAARPLLDSAYAQVYWLQSTRATQNGNPTLANESLELMVERAEAAVDGDSKLAEPYLLLARANVQNRQISDALEVLNRGLQVQDLAGNTNLLMAKADIYYQQRNYEDALYQVFLTLYVDPSIEAAYELKITIALERNRPGEAVLAAQDYLYYYPGATRAFRRLGQAFEAENKPDLALNIYSRGLSGRTTDADTVAILEARARIYRELGEGGQAIADYDRLLEITNDANYRLQRMQAFVELNQFTRAQEDAEILATIASIPQGLVRLVQGRALVEGAVEEDTARYQQAITFLTQANSSPDLTDVTLRGVGLEYLARAQFGIRSYSTALATIESAIAIAETGSRRYWRGRIHEALNNDEEAIADYEFVLTWGQIFSYPFRVDAQEHLNDLLG